MTRHVMVATTPQVSPETTLTYVQDGGRSIFRGAVDVTNIEIFRDLLAMLPSPDADVVISIGDLELRVPEAASLLVETVRGLGEGHRLVLTTDGSRARTNTG